MSHLENRDILKVNETDEDFLINFNLDKELNKVRNLTNVIKSDLTKLKEFQNKFSNESLLEKSDDPEYIKENNRVKWCENIHNIINSITDLNEQIINRLSILPLDEDVITIIT